MPDTFNFSGGPGALPETVLQQASAALLALPETGLSVLGMSHRSDWFRAVLDEAENNLRQLLAIPDDYHVLFMQGGSSLQFSMLPMNFLRGQRHAADYIVSGYWSAKAPVEARLEGPTAIAWDGASAGYHRLPSPAELRLSPDAPYLHYVANETVEGLEFPYLPGLPGVPLVCDMSSNLLAAPTDIRRYAMIYAHAQKNLGPSGVTVVILSEAFARRAGGPLPTLLDYRTHIQSRSLYNTPPVFAIYVLLLVTRWLRDDIGGLEAMAAINRKKSETLYAALNRQPDFYRLHAAQGNRSSMNVAFRLPSAGDEARLLQAARQDGFHGLDGHRSIGGLRASLYNAVSPDAVSALSHWLLDFYHRQG